MAGMTKDGQQVLPRLSEEELAGWLGKVRQAALRPGTQEVILKMQEGLPLELICRQRIEVAAVEAPSRLTLPGLETLLGRMRVAIRREVRYGELSFTVENGVLGPLVLYSRERRG